MTGFLETLAAAVRKRSREKRGVPLDELEEMAARASKDRRDFLAAVRRSRNEAGDFGPLRLVASVSGADPATEEVFAAIDPSRAAATAAEATLKALAIHTEPEIYKGRAAWIDSTRAAADLSVLRMDWFLDPTAVLEALTGPPDALLLDPAFLGRDSLNEALALARTFGVTGVVMIRSAADARTALEENPPAVLVDRRDPESLALRGGLADRILEALEDYPGVRIVTGGIDSEAAVAAAARRPIDAAILTKNVAADSELADRLARLVRAAETVSMP